MPDVTLTFDNGPEPEVTPAVLDTLARESIQATFFVLGHKIADPRRRALAERAAGEGHWIGNHTYSHDTPLGELAGAVAEVEIGRTQALIGDLSHPDKLFRPFGSGGVIGAHLLSPAALRFLEAGGYSCVLWNVIPRDFDDAQTWPERALDLMRPLPWALVVITTCRAAPWRSSSDSSPWSVPLAAAFARTFLPTAYRCAPGARSGRCTAT
jgi:peptidoglycan/xylan/chitin deacetylase (PgdA/CDA1 family)